MESKLAMLVDDCVAGIAAALVTDHHIVILRQQVHHAAFALVTPVDSYNCAIRHRYPHVFTANVLPADS